MLPPEQQDNLKALPPKEPEETKTSESSPDDAAFLRMVGRFLGVGLVVTVAGVIWGSAQFPGVAFDPHYPQGRDNIMLVFGCSFAAGFVLGLLAAYLPLRWGAGRDHTKE